MRRVRVYFNSSILIRAVNPREVGHRRAIHFIHELRRRGYVLVISNVHLKEGYRSETWRRLKRLFRKFNFIYCRVNVDVIEDDAVSFVRRRGYSDERIIDVMHLIAAQRCDCGFIAAIDRFIRTHAPEFGLKYINYYTGIP